MVCVGLQGHSGGANVGITATRKETAHRTDVAINATPTKNMHRTVCHRVGRPQQTVQRVLGEATTQTVGNPHRIRLRNRVPLSSVWVLSSNVTIDRANAVAAPAGAESGSADAAPPSLCEPAKSSGSPPRPPHCPVVVGGGVGECRARMCRCSLTWPPRRDAWAARLRAVRAYARRCASPRHLWRRESDSDGAVATGE